MLFRSNDTATTEIYTVMNTLSLHDALPISGGAVVGGGKPRHYGIFGGGLLFLELGLCEVHGRRESVGGFNFYIWLDAGAFPVGR